MAHDKQRSVSETHDFCSFLIFSMSIEAVTRQVSTFFESCVKQSNFKTGISEIVDGNF